MITFPGVSPFWMWTGFIALVGVMLWIDLGAFNRKDHVVGIKESLLWTAFWITLSLIFNAFLWWKFGSQVGLEYLTGYVIEKSLSMDNLFVFLMIFTAFNIPRIYQHRVLFWGIVGAALMRGLFIGLGAELVKRYVWIFLFFAIAVLWGAYHMQFQKEKKFSPKTSKVVRFTKWIVPVYDKIKGHHFFVKKPGKLFSAIPFPYHATILFLALVTIEVTDVVFATDSIPAIFAITQDPFIVFTSNMFAILGLRALYFAIAGLHAMFVYLKSGLAFILAFVGVKMVFIGLPAFLEAVGITRHGIPHFHIPTLWSLGIILGVLTISILASVWKTKKHGRLRRERPEHGIRVSKGHHHTLNVTPSGMKKWK